MLPIWIVLQIVLKQYTMYIVLIIVTFDVNNDLDLLQLTDWKHERLNTPTSHQNTWTPVLNFIEIYM